MRLRNMFLLLCGAMLMVSCFDNSYDLDDIDKTLQFGSAEKTLWLPNSSVDSISLLNVMDLDDNSIVKVVWDERDQDSIFCINADGTDNMFAVTVLGSTEVTIHNLTSDPMKMDNRPDCLDGDSVCLDMVNPMLISTVKNDVGININVVLAFYTWKDGVIVDSVYTPAVYVPANSEMSYYFSKTEDELLPARYKGSEWKPTDVGRLLTPKVKRGSEAVTVVPDSVTSLAKHVTLTNPSTEIASGKISLKYSVFAPFRFNKDFCIIYEQIGEGWHEDLDVTDVDFREVVGEADVVNGLPLSLALDLTPIDVDGNEIDALVVSSPTAEAMKTTHIEFSIKAKDGGSLTRFTNGNPDYQQLDGVRMRLKIAANGRVVSNALSHDAALRMEKVRVGVRGGIIYDAN